MRFLGIDVELLTPAERADLANGLLRAAWSAVSHPTSSPSPRCRR